MLVKIIKNHIRDLDIVIAQDIQDAVAQATSSETFGFIILDVEIKENTPREILDTIHDIMGVRPCIFLGHESFITDLVDQNLYSRHEYNDTVYKPITRDDFKDELINKVNSIYDYAKRVEFEESIIEVNPDDFFKLRLKSFYMHQSFPHDVYLEITKTRYLKVLSANKRYTHTQINQYSKRGVRFLFVKKTAHLEYLGTELKKLTEIITHLGHDHEKIHLSLLKGISLIHQYFQSLGVTEDSMKLLKLLIQKIKEQTLSRRDVLDLLKSYPLIYQGVASKALLTAYFCHLTCLKMSWESELMHDKLICASIIQDYMLEVDEMSSITSSKDKTLYQFTEEEVKKFLDHPKRSQELASQIQGFSDLENLVGYQHENPMRTGFPHQPSHLHLTALNGIFNISQFVASHIDGQKINKNKLSELLMDLNKDFNTGSFKDPLQALKSMLRESFEKKTAVAS